MSGMTAALKRHGETLTALIYCLIVALMEIAMFTIQKSSLDGVLARLLSETDIRLLFLPCAAMMHLLRGENKRATLFAAIYAAAALLLTALGAVGVIPGFDWMQSLAAILKAAALLAACGSNKKSLRIALIAVYAVAEIGNLFALYQSWGVPVIAITLLLIPAIILWIRALLPEQDIYTGMYNASASFSMQRLLCLGASFVCGFLFMILALSLLGSYSAHFTNAGIYAILISCALSWLSAFVLLNLAD
ncbi:MAG: hypothetical protein IJU28_03755 [Clostridia bacterium]|nr:hypothetical protein [Clostridia bacterium]